MSISKREKIMLTGLVVIASAYFTYTNLFVPQIEKFQLQKKALRGNIQIKSKLDSGMLNKDELEEKVKSMKVVIDEIDQSLPGYVHQENVILYLKDLFSRNNIEVSAVSYSEPGEDFKPEEDVSIEQAIEEYIQYLDRGEKIEIREYSPKGDGEGEEDGKQSEGEKAKMYNSMGVNISFTGMYSDVKNALKDIEQNRKKIIIKNLALNNTSENITGSISLEFPFYPDGKEIRNGEWDIESEYGNLEPFMTGRLSLLENPSQGNAKETERTPKQSNPALAVDSDFYIVLKPISSDMPTVTMGKSPYRYTAVYEDSNSFKEANLYVKKEGGQYLFRYETNSHSYPAGEGAYEAMEPFGDDIVVKVYSMKRLNSADSSGLVLNVYNDSGKKVKVYVNGDDSSNPRLRTNVKSGNVETQQF